ncbi:MAG: hypothetical protein AB7O30_14385 [Dehalococcoidia bacterium]
MIIGAVTFSSALIAAAASGPTANSKVIANPPSRGPSGQDSPATWLANPATAYSGGAEDFGPYRLLPPGTEYIRREYTDQNPATSITEATDVAVLRDSELYIPPLQGFDEVQIRGLMRDSEVLAVDQVWKSHDGALIYLSVGRIPSWMLPLDVYLYPDDSILQVFTTTIDGRPTVIEQPRNGPSANVGYVRVWLNGQELALRSPSIDQVQLSEIAYNASKRKREES